MKRTHSNSAGQILILFAVGLIALIALAALVLDGGQFLLNRRAAQAAADAGALAGAYNYCAGGGNAASAIATARDYAITKNGASTDTTASLSAGVVSVNAVMKQNSFFANIFGVTNLNVSASAAAGCYSPSSMKVLPIAWSCKQPFPSTSSATTSDSPACEVKWFDWTSQMKPMITGQGLPITIDDLKGGTITITQPVDFHATYNFSANPPSPLPQIYIIMDSASSINDVWANCIPYGTINCDLNGDGKIDIIGSGNRSWLDLNGGGGGAADLKSWLRYGYPNPIAVHTWVAGQTGDISSVYQTVQTYEENQVNILPIFNQFCSGYPTQACEDAAHTYNPLPPGGYDTIATTSASSATYFHIIGFAEFYITCVKSPGADHYCPAHAAGVAKGIFPDNTSTIEGYFVTGYTPPGGGGAAGTGGVDMGVYIRSLQK